MTPLLGNKQAVEASRRIKTCAETAIKLNPRNDFAWHMLGRWHQELAQVSGVTRTLAQIVYGGLPSASLEEAKTCFEKAAALAPKRLIHAVELGRTYALLGKKDEARQWIRRGLSLPDRDKDDPETRQRGLATLRQLGDR
jgi:tetratricopeptide (TPR) repeat protein